MRSKFALALGTWFGCGYAPVAPGTVGSVAALLIAIAGHHYLGWGRIEFLLLAVLVSVPGLWAAQQVASRIGKDDPGIVVIDEVAGQWLTLVGVAAFNWKTWIGAFVLFRLFDIWKPPPVRRLERLPGGAGVMADDLAAGLYGAFVLYLVGTWNWY